MATLPKATTSVSDTAGALAGGLDVLTVFAPCATSADLTPRLFGGAQAVYDQHGYCEGVEYTALHARDTRKPFIVIGLPIITAGVVSRENTSGNTGTSVTTVVAGSDGVLAEHDGAITVLTGGTIGTDQIVIGLSLDGSRNVKRVRIGTASSHTPVYFGVTINFAAGTLVAGDTIHTWHGSAPLSNAANWQLAREALAAQQRSFRSILNIGDFQTVAEAQAFKVEMVAYETANERFTIGHGSVYDRAPLASMANTTVSMTGSAAVTFAEVGATGDTITRASGSFTSDGFQVGDIVTITGTASNDQTTATAITGVSALVITLDTDDLAAETISGITITGTPSIVFDATGDTITRSRGSFLTDGFRVGDLVDLSGSVSNDTAVTAAEVSAVTATVLSFTSAALANEVIGESAIVVGAGQTKAAWMAEIDAAFSAVDAEFRISLSAGRSRILSPFSGWDLRRPVSWTDRLREYAHDLHIATWRKSDGPVNGDLFDSDGTLVEWDDRVDGSAGVAARFSVLRTWANGPNGAFMALSLTRETEGSLLTHVHNVNVVNLVCATVQLNTENVIGRSLTLNDDSTATTDELGVIKGGVDTALELAVLGNAQGEGARASKAVWTPSATDDFGVAEPTLTGSVELILNGTVFNVATSVKV